MQKDKLIRHLNKQTNVTYLYWGHPTYVAGLKFPKVEKKCIGKINSKGEFEPNKTFLALSAADGDRTGSNPTFLHSPCTRGDVPRLVASELRKRKIKHGLPVDYARFGLCTKIGKFRVFVKYEMAQELPDKRPIHFA